MNGIDLEKFEEIIKTLAPKIVAIDFVEFTPSGIEELDKIYLSSGLTVILKTIAEIIKAKG